MAHVSCYITRWLMFHATLQWPHVSTSCSSHLGLIWLCYEAFLILIFGCRVFFIVRRPEIIQFSLSSRLRRLSSFCATRSADLPRSDLAKPTVRVVASSTGSFEFHVESKLELFKSMQFYISIMIIIVSNSFCFWLNKFSLD